MKNDDLWEFLKIEANNLSNEMRKASISGKGTSQEIADLRESAFTKFLEKQFPFPHKVSKGKVRDNKGNISNSIDHILINPSHPYFINQEGKFEFMFADGVDLVIELKPSIKDFSEVKRGLKQLQSVKKIRRIFPPAKFANKQLKILSTYIPCFIYSFEYLANIGTLMERIYDFYVSENIPLEEQFDFIILHDKGIIQNGKSLARPTFNYGGKPSIGMTFQETAEYTLPAFLWHANDVYHATSVAFGGDKYMQSYLGGFDSKLEGKSQEVLMKSIIQ